MQDPSAALAELPATEPPLRAERLTGPAPRTERMGPVLPVLLDTRLVRAELARLRAAPASAGPRSENGRRPR